MTEIQERIERDLRTALKAREKLRLSTLRLLASELRNRRIELGRDLDEAEAIDVLTRARKQRLEAEEQYRSGGREELAEREAREAEIVEEYLPEPLSDDELDRWIEEAVEEVGAAGMRDMGRVMGEVMPRVRGRAEGSEVSRRVRERLERG